MGREWGRGVTFSLTETHLPSPVFRTGRSLWSHLTQTTIRLEKNDFFTFTAMNGVNVETFVEYLNVRIIQVSAPPCSGTAT